MQQRHTKVQLVDMVVEAQAPAELRLVEVTIMTRSRESEEGSWKGGERSALGGVGMGEGSLRGSNSEVDLVICSNSLCTIYTLIWCFLIKGH